MLHTLIIVDRIIAAEADVKSGSGCNSVCDDTKG